MSPPETKELESQISPSNDADISETKELESQAPLSNDADTSETKDLESQAPPSKDADKSVEDDEFLVTWEEGDAENPRNWKHGYRMFMVFVVSMYTLLSPISSTMNAPALDTLKREFQVDSEPITSMMMSAPMLAFTVAPMIYGPLSERLGRKYILQVSNIMYVNF